MRPKKLIKISLFPSICYKTILNKACKNPKTNDMVKNTMMQFNLQNNVILLTRQTQKNMILNKIDVKKIF